MNQDRRSIMTAIGIALPFGLGPRLATATATPSVPPVLRFQSFEVALREAFLLAGNVGRPEVAQYAAKDRCCRVEVGHSAVTESGIQGCHNDRPFAGFPVGHLRIVRCGFGPGPVVGGVRLYVATVDVAWTAGRDDGRLTRPLDFASLPDAAVADLPEPHRLRLV